ncbi:hypothetical protein MMC17_008237 [Xylographa soralifera]|nr:hypothetical protein [Xylographa soralifera]
MKNQYISILGVAAALSNRALAAPWSGPDPTPTGLMAQVGISPRPTEAPGLNGIPKELLVRQGEVPFPPPNNWCGFVDGDGTDPLSCAASLTCVYSGAVLGCCDAGPISLCTNIYTTCSGIYDLCDAACQENYNILKCSYSDYPYCGTYNFDAGTRLYDCQSLPNEVYTVEFLADYYSSRGETLAGTAGPVIITAASQTLPTVETVMATATITVPAVASGSTGNVQSSTPGALGTSQTQTSSSPETSSGNDTSGNITKSQSGLSMGAIIGIAVGGGGAVLLIIAGLVAFCCIKRRNRSRRTRGHALPIEHHFPPIEKPKASGPYASVPQQDQAPTATQMYAGGKAFDAPRPFSSVNRKPIGSTLSPDTARFSAATVSSQSTHTPYPQHPSISEVDGDPYKGAPLHHVEEVEAVSPPLNVEGHRTYEMEHTEREYEEHDGLYEMGVEGVSMGPQFSGPYEMEHERYGQ